MFWFEWFDQRTVKKGSVFDFVPWLNCIQIVLLSDDIKLMLSLIIFFFDAIDWYWVSAGRVKSTESERIGLLPNLSFQPWETWLASRPMLFLEHSYYRHFDEYS